jgi:hypothetical protein
MSKADRKDFLEVLCVESDEDRERTMQVGRALIRQSITHGRYAVMECNGDGGEWREHRQEVVSDRLERMAESLGVTLELGGDPRGYTVKLMTPKSGRYNTWGGAECGWGVPQ